MVYEFDKTNIQNAVVYAQELQTALNKSLEEAKSFFSEQQNSSMWTGSAKKSFLAFLDLVTQYHERIALIEGAEVFSEAASEMLNKLNAFHANDALVNLKRI